MNHPEVVVNHPEVVVFGDALIDYQYWVERLPEAGEDAAILSHAVNSGGSALNMAIALSVLGVNTALWSCVGKDALGDELLALMRERPMPLDTSLVSRNGETGYTVTMIDARAERTMFSYRGASSSVNLTQFNCGRAKRCFVRQDLNHFRLCTHSAGRRGVAGGGGGA